MKNILAPSILSADFGHLADAVKETAKAGAPYIHIDVMDGMFVPSISYGMPVIRSIRPVTDAVFDVHLMIEDPDKYIADFITEKTSFVTVHQEACRHLHRTVQLIRSLGVHAGVALNPATPLSTLQYMWDDLDMVLVMSVNPGFGGQKFIPSALDKIRQLAQIREEMGAKFLIEVDGGATLSNAKELTEAGVDILVAGSAVFGAEDIVQRTKDFVSLIG